MKIWKVVHTYEPVQPLSDVLNRLESEGWEVFQLLPEQFSPDGAVKTHIRIVAWKPAPANADRPDVDDTGTPPTPEDYIENRRSKEEILGDLDRIVDDLNAVHVTISESQNRLRQAIPEAFQGID